jgi:hypothetical protein
MPVGGNIPFFFSKWPTNKQRWKEHGALILLHLRKIREKVFVLFANDERLYVEGTYEEDKIGYLLVLQMCLVEQGQSVTLYIYALPFH